MKLLEPRPAIPPYELTDQERECLIYRPETPPRPDGEMAEGYGQGGGPRDGRPPQRDRQYDTGPRGRDRGPRPDRRNDYRNDQQRGPREMVNMDSAPRTAPVEQPAPPPAVTEPEPIQVAPAPVSEPDSFGAGVE